jgi:Aminoglycoside-2''-adenylyltransferase
MRWDDVPWEAWEPDEAARRLRGVEAPWYVAAGWAIDLFLGGSFREHDDLEIAVSNEYFPELERALDDLTFYVVVEHGQIAPLDEARARLGDTHQTWGLDVGAHAWRIDVFREPCVDGRWVCRRDGRITLTYDELIEHAPGGIPYARPEVVLLFKARAARPKDEVDLARVLPRLDPDRRALLASWLELVHPGHFWIPDVRRGRAGTGEPGSGG